MIEVEHPDWCDPDQCRSDGSGTHHAVVLLDRAPDAEGRRLQVKLAQTDEWPAAVFVVGVTAEGRRLYANHITADEVVDVAAALIRAAQLLGLAREQVDPLPKGRPSGRPSDPV